MEGLVEGRLLENAFEDPLFNVWSYLSVKDLVLASQASKEIGGKSIFGFIANEIFSGFHLPLVFDNSSDYDLEQLILQLKRYHVPTKPRQAASVDKPDTPRAPAQTDDDAAPEKQVSRDDSDEDESMFLMHRHLESASFDEYDDFTPRHPVPKDKVHRRGDSYFNSDISEVARLATDRTVSAAVRKFANITLQTELAEDPVIDVKAEVSPHIPTFRTDFTSGNSKTRGGSVFTFEN